MYDIIIIGGGISGLNCALELSKDHNILLLDDRTYLGGRLYTHKRPKYEVGGARFHKKHKLLCNLIKCYNLTCYPLDKQLDYLDKDKGIIKNANKEFNEMMNKVLVKGKKMSKEKLIQMTFKELCSEVYTSSEIKKLINIFGYTCEFEFFNAYNGLDTFSRDFGDQKYYVLGEGLSFLCEKIGNSIKTQGGTIYLNKMVKDVVKCDTCYNVCCDVGDYLGKKIIFAIKPHQMEMFSILKPVKHLFKSVKAGKLLRIYAKFPIYKDGVWFKNMNRITTNSFLRHVIPISEEDGLIMISYTDGRDVNKFMNGNKLKTNKQIETLVMNECRELFHEKKNTRSIVF